MKQRTSKGSWLCWEDALCSTHIHEYSHTYLPFVPPTVGLFSSNCVSYNSSLPEPIRSWAGPSNLEVASWSGTYPKERQSYFSTCSCVSIAFRLWFSALEYCLEISFHTECHSPLTATTPLVQVWLPSFAHPLLLLLLTGHLRTLPVRSRALLSVDNSPGIMNWQELYRSLLPGSSEDNHHTYNTHGESNELNGNCWSRSVSLFGSGVHCKRDNDTTAPPVHSPLVTAKA